MSDLYNRIETLCNDHKISITTMCKESGASRASLSDLKVGRKQKLSADTLSKIATFFNVSVDFLLGKDEDLRALKNAREELSKSININPSMPSGERLDVLFNVSGYDHVVVCFNLGIERCYIDNWLNSNDLPPKPIIDKVLGVFCIKPEDLLPINELKEYNKQIGEWGSAAEKAPTGNGERCENGDILDEVDIAFYGDYKELTEENKETLRAMARLFRERQDKQE